MKQTADDLRAALALLRDGAGWLKGSGADNENKRYCAIVALNLSAPGERALRAHDALRRAIQEIKGDAHFYSIPIWNDDVARTWSDMKRAYELAIANEEKTP